MKSVLFICTGNIFRSMVAEHALKAQMAPGDALIVESAGTHPYPMAIYDAVRERLIERGIDPSGHSQRKLTQEMLDDAGLPVAMSLDHQTFVRDQYGREIPLFNRVCYGRDEPVLDLGESLTDGENDAAAAEAYVRQMVDTIWEAMPRFRENMVGFLADSEGQNQDASGSP